MDKERITKLLHYQVSPKITNVLGFVILFCFSCLLFVCNAEMVPVVDESMTPFLYWSTTRFAVYAYLTLGMVLGVLYCLSGNLFLSYVFLEFVTICWGFANRIVYFTRDQFITIEEFDVLGEAAAVNMDLGQYFHPILLILIFLGIVNGIFVWLLTRRIMQLNRCKNRRRVWTIRLSLIVVMVFAFVGLHRNPYQGSLYNIHAHKNTGCVVWFCQSLFGNTIQAVSSEEVSSIYDNFAELVETDEASEKRPNVIVIMSESFWDVNNLEGVVEASENPMDLYSEVTENAVTGQVAVNIFGGGTNVSEFEFLTGLNSRYLDSSNCYSAYYSLKQQSVVSYMKDLGYYTMAFHPYDGEFWDRELGYASMGFDEFYSDVDFVNRQLCHGYISDKSLTEEIIERFEEQKEIAPEQPVFSFAVSVQNHVGDLEGVDESAIKEGCSTITTSVIGKQVDVSVSEDVEEYYNGLRESIEALAELMDYFEAYEEDTVIVFFGDHAPTFVKTICDTEGRETEMNLYRTPYMIWTNYENDFESYGDMSLSYLSAVLIEYLDLPKPYQYYMNRYMLEQYPINTNYEQEYLDTLEEQRLLDMMSIVSTICKRFPKEEMALPYWQVAE